VYEECEEDYMSEMWN